MTSINVNKSQSKQVNQKMLLLGECGEAAIWHDGNRHYVEVGTGVLKLDDRQWESLVAALTRATKASGSVVTFKKK